MVNRNKIQWEGNKINSKKKGFGSQLLVFGGGLNISGYDMTIHLIHYYAILVEVSRNN